LPIYWLTPLLDTRLSVSWMATHCIPHYHPWNLDPFGLNSNQFKIPSPPSSGADKIKRKGLNSLIILGAWILWKHRNACVFEGARPSIQHILQNFSLERKLWHLAGAHSLQAIGPGRRQALTVWRVRVRSLLSVCFISLNPIVLFSPSRPGPEWGGGVL
jgi:hypothetical protein